MEKKKRTIHEIDATGEILGRLATKVANLLRGKNKVDFAFHIDNGDSVVIYNADKIKVTGAKLEQKTYVHYSGYPGGLKQKKLAELIVTNPEQVVKKAVNNMLPKNKLRPHMIKRLTFK